MSSQYYEDDTQASNIRFEHIPIISEADTQVRFEMHLPMSQSPPRAQSLPMDESEGDEVPMPPLVDSESEDDKPVNLVASREARRVKNTAVKLVEDEKNFAEMITELTSSFASTLKMDGAELKNTARAILDKTANAEMRQCIEGGSSVNDAIRHTIAEIHVKNQ